MRQRAGRSRSRTGLLVALLLAAGSASLVAVHVRAYPTLSPIDELQHIDYLAKAAHGELVGRGERVGETAMREEVCRGIDAPLPLPSCSAPRLRPEQFQEAGYNTAYVHPPTYYGISGIIARAGRAVFGLESLVTAGRLTGGLWLAAAVLLLWLALGDLRVGRLARAALIALLVCSPTVLHAASTVNPDAMAVLFGSALLLSVLRWEAGRWPLLAPVAVAGLAILVKSTNVVAVGAAILYVVARHGSALWAQRHPESAPPDALVDASVEHPATTGVDGRRQVVRFSVGLVAAVALASVAWVAVQGTIAEAPADEIPMMQRFKVDSISVHDVVGELGSSITPLRRSHIPKVLASSDVVSAVHVFDTALIAGLVIAAVYGLAGSRRRSLAVASIVAMAASGPLFVVINFVFIGTFVEIPARYALSVVPFALAAASVALERRALLVATTAYAGWLVFITLWALL